MAGWNPNLLFAITQIETTFVNGIGATRRGTGTGFYLRTEAGTPVFVTNKHNLDPSLTIGADFKLKRVRLLLRRVNGQTFERETSWSDVNIDRSSILTSRDADVAAILNPAFIDVPADHNFFTINRPGNLADSQLFEQRIFAMDVVSFWGYAGTTTSKWWDTEWNLAIARSASLASRPHVPFSNEGIVTADTVLVSGLSFNGSSGSLVLLHEKGIAPGGDIEDAMYVPFTIIGIMSGHWWDEGHTPEMFRHSGLSYFTRSTSIISLLQDIP